jgi:hypothetical protein
MTNARIPLISILLCLALGNLALGLEHVTLRRDGENLHVSGRVLVEAVDGGLLIEARDGLLWGVQPDEIVKRKSDEVPFKPLDRKEMAEKLLAELPDGFSVLNTANYMIFHDTSPTYAKWCGALFERLHRAFSNYWRQKGFKLAKPEFPLTAVIFADKRTYTQFARSELGDAAGSIIGYFSLRTNRMTMYDLTGIETLRRYANSRGTSKGITRILAQPDAQRTVATIIHEATHQIAHNCGLHQRYSDCPVWFSEGIAVYFETPDLTSSKGWRGIGVVNRPRLAVFRNYLRSRPPNSLETLLRDDKRFHDTSQSLETYAEAWALTYFLIHQHPKKYVEYLKLLSQKKPLIYADGKQRLEEFKKVFGDLDLLDMEFLRFIKRVR